MTENKRYEILESLPVYGPMYVPVTDNDEPFYSEGFPVCFYKEDGTNWVANFQPGLTELNEIHELATPNLLITAGGTCYIMSPEQVKPISVLGFDYRAVFKAQNNRLVLQASICLTIVEKKWRECFFSDILEEFPGIGLKGKTNWLCPYRAYTSNDM